MVKLSVLNALIAANVPNDKLGPLCEALSVSEAPPSKRRRRRKSKAAPKIVRRRNTATRRSEMTALPGGEAAE